MTEHELFLRNELLLIEKCIARMNLTDMHCAIEQARKINELIDEEKRNELKYN